MNRWALAAAVAPPAIYLAATQQHRGFMRQPSVVMTLKPERFAARVDAVGGAAAVRTGVWIDLGFIVVLTVPSGLVLLASARPSLATIAAAAALVDWIEDGLLLGALRQSTKFRLKLLAAAALAKYAAYLGVLIADVWATGLDKSQPHIEVEAVGGYL